MTVNTKIQVNTTITEEQYEGLEYLLFLNGEETELPETFKGPLFLTSIFHQYLEPLAVRGIIGRGFRSDAHSDCFPVYTATKRTFRFFRKEWAKRNK